MGSSKLSWNNIDDLSDVEFQSLQHGDILRYNSSINTWENTTDFGVPAGGTSGQILLKSSSDDYDAEWIDRDIRDYSTVYIANNTTGSKQIVIPQSTSLTLDPFDVNSHYVQALNMYTSYFHYDSGFNPLPDGTIQLTGADVHVRMSFFVNGSFSTNNAIVAVALGAYIPPPVGVQAWAPNYIANQFLNQDKLGTITAYAIFPPPAPIPGIIYSLWFASSLAGTFTIQSSIFGLEAVH